MFKWEYVHVQIIFMNDLCILSILGIFFNIVVEYTTQKYYCINCKFYQPKNKNKLRTGVLDSESILKQHILQKLSVPNLYFLKVLSNGKFCRNWVFQTYIFWKYSRMTKTGCFKPIFFESILKHILQKLDVPNLYFWKVFSNDRNWMFQTYIFLKYSRTANFARTGCSKLIYFESILEWHIFQELSVPKVFSNIAHWKYSVDWTQDLHIAFWKHSQPAYCMSNTRFAHCSLKVNVGHCILKLFSNVLLYKFDHCLLKAFENSILYVEQYYILKVFCTLNMKFELCILNVFLYVEHKVWTLHSESILKGHIVH